MRLALGVWSFYSRNTDHGGGLGARGATAPKHLHDRKKLKLGVF